VIVWSFLNPTFYNVGRQTQSMSRCMEIEVKPVGCVRNSTGLPAKFNATIELTRGDTTGLNAKAIFLLQDQTTVLSDPVSFTGVLARSTTPDVILNTGTTSVKAVAIIKDDQGKDFLCPESAISYDCP